MRGEGCERAALRLTEARPVGAPAIGKQTALQLIILPPTQIADIVAAGIAFKYKEAAAWTGMHCLCVKKWAVAV